MVGHNLEPRTVLWAVTELSWEDHTGTPNRSFPALEDTSPSDARRFAPGISVSNRRRVPTPRKESYAAQRIVSQFLAQARRHSRAPQNYTHGGSCEAIATLSGRRPDRSPKQSALLRRHLPRRRYPQPALWIWHPQMCRHSEQ